MKIEGSINRVVRLKSRPSGIPLAEHFEIIEAPIPEPRVGQVLIRNIYLSVDPAMRGWVNATANYMDTVPIGAVMRSFAVGRVVESQHPLYSAGDVVTGMFGWQYYACVDANAIEYKVDEGKDFPISAALGVLGLNGLTAYFALLEIGRPKPGETVVVSAAAGAVGSCAGQIARIQGCRAVAITDGPAKARMCLEEFGYDRAIDYLTEDVHETLKAACPDGVDVYFDTTSGPISDAVMEHLQVKARVVVCGTMAITDWDPIPWGPRVERHLLVKRARMEGFLYSDYANRSTEGRKALAGWILDGSIRYREEILEGIEQAPGSIAGLYRGENLGKRLIKIAEADAGFSTKIMINANAEILF
jgi:NADPH-dependent curcumin reductase